MVEPVEALADLLPVQLANLLSVFRILIRILSLLVLHSARALHESDVSASGFHLRTTHSTHRRRSSSVSSSAR